MDIEQQIKLSQQWMEESNGLIDGMAFQTTKRSRVAVALHHLCIEHQKGIHTLIDLGVVGSARSQRVRLEFLQVRQPLRNVLLPLSNVVFLIVLARVEALT